MKTLIRCALALAVGAVAVGPAFADLRVATSLTDLASVAQHVGGKHVTVQSLCRGYEDPHFVPAKPSLMKAIQHADVFVSTGLELDGGWLPLVLPGSRNPRIQPGTRGFVDASQGVAVLEKPVGTVSRAEGDIHPLGNPHYYLDPKALEVVADHLAEVFSRLALLWPSSMSLSWPAARVTNRNTVRCSKTGCSTSCFRSSRIWSGLRPP